MEINETRILKRALCAGNGMLFIPRLCPKCGDQVDVSGLKLHAVRENVFGCPKHKDEVRQEVRKGIGMWPSDWFGSVYRKGHFAWINTFDYMLDE